MTIGIDIRTLMDAQYSGVSEYTHNLVNTLLKLDRNNEYRLFYNSLRSQRGLKRNWARTNAEVRGWRWPNKALNYIFFKFLNWPKIDKALDADIFFVPHINFIGLLDTSPLPLLIKEGNAAIIPPLYKRGRRRGKNILTIHDLSFLRYPEFFNARKNFWHRMINIKKLVKKFDYVVAVSENTKNDILELCDVAPEKVVVIYSGVDKEFQNLQFPIFPPKADPPRADNFQTNSKFKIQNSNKKDISQSSEIARLREVKMKYNLHFKFILFLGTIEPRKNIGGLISAYEKLRNENKNLENYKLVIAGGKGWRSEGIYKKWQKSKYKNDIKFLGYVKKEDKVFLYNLASLFVYPSFYEGFGFPPLEAMASGLPVITSFTSSLAEVVGGAGLMIDPCNITDLVRAIEQVLINNELKNSLISKGIERAKEFSWDKTGREYLELFKSF